MSRGVHIRLFRPREEENETVGCMRPETVQFMLAALENFFVVIGPGEELASDDETVEVQVITNYYCQLAMLIEEEAKSPEATWPEKPKEEKKKVRPVAVALAAAEARTEKKRPAAPDATWPEEPKKQKSAEFFFSDSMFEGLEEAEAPKEDKPAVEAPLSGEARAAPETSWPEATWPEVKAKQQQKKVSLQHMLAPAAVSPPACSICRPPSSRENGSSRKAEHRRPGCFESEDPRDEGLEPCTDLQNLKRCLRTTAQREPGRDPKERRLPNRKKSPITEAPGPRQRGRRINALTAAR